MNALSVMTRMHRFCYYTTNVFLQTSGTAWSARGLKSPSMSIMKLSFLRFRASVPETQLKNSFTKWFNRIFSI